MFELREEIPELCCRAFDYINSHRPIHALALAWTVCVHRSESEYVALSKSSFRMHGGRIDERMLDALATNEEGAVAEVTRLSREDPCFLLQFLARLCKAWAPVDEFDTPLLTAPLSLYQVDGIFHIELSDEDLASFDLGSHDRQIFVLQEHVARTHKAPMEDQVVNRHFHTPGWLVLSREIVRHNAHRRFDIQPCPPLFKQTTLTWWRREPQVLRVYLAEFADGPQFRAVQDLPHGVWLADSLSNDLSDEVRAHLKRAVSVSADVVVFPELCISDALSDLISDWLFDNHSSAPHPLGLVVAGSFHRPGNGGVVNQALAFGEDGEPLAPFAHVKLTSVHLQRASILEGNKTGDTVTAAPSALGLQAVVICLDLGQRATEDAVPLEHLPLSWLWVPSLSNKVSAHQARSSDIQLRQVCTVACANQGPAEFMPGMLSGFAAGQSFVMSGSARGELRPFAQSAGLWAAYDVPFVTPCTAGPTES